MGKIFLISLKLNFTRKTLGCYGLKKKNIGPIGQSPPNDDTIGFDFGSLLSKSESPSGIGFSRSQANLVLLLSFQRTKDQP